MENVNVNEAPKKNRRPFGFYVCSIVFMLERMAYYSAKYLILSLYLQQF